MPNDTTMMKVRLLVREIPLSHQRQELDPRFPDPNRLGPYREVVKEIHDG